MFFILSNFWYWLLNPMIHLLLLNSEQLLNLCRCRWIYNPSASCFTRVCSLKWMSSHSVKGKHCKVMSLQCNHLWTCCKLLLFLLEIIYAAFLFEMYSYVFILQCTQVYSIFKIDFKVWVSFMIYFCIFNIPFYTE